MAPGRQRIWVCTDMYYPEDVSTGYYVTRIAEGLARAADVRVLCGQPSYTPGSTKAPPAEWRNGTAIRRVAATHFPKDRLALRVLNVLTFTLSMIFRGLRDFRRGDIVLCLTNPPTLPPFLATICRWKGCRFVLLVHDVFPETAAVYSGIRAGNPLYRIAAAFSGIAYRNADAVIALGRDMADTVRRKGAAHVSIIENWADLDEIAPLAPEHNRLRAELGLADKRILQFSGNIGRTHDIERALAFADALKAYPDWVVLFAGFGGKAGLVAAAAAKPGSNVRIVPRQPRARLNELLNLADAFLIALSPGMLGLSVPSRMYNMLAAGKPVLAFCHPASEVAAVLAEAGCGWALGETAPEGGDPIGMLADREELERRGAAARAHCLEHYGFDAIFGKYEALFELRGEPGGPAASGLAVSAPAGQIGGD